VRIVAVTAEGPPSPGQTDARGPLSTVDPPWWMAAFSRILCAAVAGVYLQSGWLHYLLAYWLNRRASRAVLGRAPVIRRSRGPGIEEAIASPFQRRSVLTQPMRSRAAAATGLPRSHRRGDASAERCRTMAGARCRHRIRHTDLPLRRSTAR
jgi:hypothetical protein